MGQVATYADVDRESSRMAHGLAALGIGRGEMVSTMLDNSLDAILLICGITRLGAVIAPVNTSFRGEFLRHQLADTGSRIVVADGDYAERILGLSDDLPDLHILAYRGDRPTQDKSVRNTSGTTGPSKGCMIPHNYLCNVGRLNAAASDFTDRDATPGTARIRWLWSREDDRTRHKAARFDVAHLTVARSTS